MMKLAFLNNKCYLFIIFIFTLFSQNFAQTAFKIPEKPNIVYPVNDFANVLNESDKSTLNQKLIDYNNLTSTEILVIIVKNLDGDEPNYVAANWGKKWNVGQKTKNNGIILFITIEDRKITIQNGRGTEDLMTDYRSSEIINKSIKPFFKEQKYFLGIDSGLNEIFRTLQGKYKNDIQRKSKSDVNYPIIIIVIIIIFLYSYSSNRNKRKNNILIDGKGSYKTSRFDLNIGGFTFSSGSDSFSNDSDFGGFGSGGDFGGGGATGDW